MAASRVMGTGEPQWPSEERLIPAERRFHGELTVKGETLTLCKEREYSGNGSDTDRREGP